MKFIGASRHKTWLFFYWSIEGDEERQVDFPSKEAFSSSILETMTSSIDDTILTEM